MSPTGLFALLAAATLLGGCAGDEPTLDKEPDEDPLPSSKKPEVNPPRLAVSVTCAEETACTVFSDGTVWCWGAGTSFGVGDGTTAYPLEKPVQVLIDHVRKLYFSGLHFCALHFSGGVSCWGSNSWQQLGTSGIVLGSTVPVRVADVAHVEDMILIGASSVALLPGAKLIGWGGLSTSDPAQPVLTTSSPVRLASGVAAASIQSGLCIVDEQGTVLCRGLNYAGQLGPQNPVVIPSLTAVAGVDPAAGLADSAEYQCAWLKNGRVQCWGSSLPIPIDGSRDALVEPVYVPGFDDILDLYADSWKICGIDSKGEVSCVGTRPGTGNQVDEVATPVPELGPVGSFCLGQNFACAVREHGPVVCWGANNDGQLGQKTWSTTPIEVEFPFIDEDADSL